MLAVLLCIMGIFTLCQPTAGRRKTALLFTIPTLVFTLVSESFADDWYYTSAALTDSFTVILLSCLVVADKLAIRLMIFSALSMCLNVIGLVMYEMYQPSTFYDVAFLALYVGVIIALTDRRRGPDVGLGEYAWFCPRRRRNDGAGSGINRQGGTEV